MEVEECPLCDVCQHYHHQGVKCSVCGHIGKSQMYPKMKIKASILRQFRCEFINAAQMDAMDGQWEVICELRKVLAEELQTPPDQEFNQLLEASSFHMVAYTGDAPIATARYQLSSIGEVNCAIVDRFVVLPQYRQKGLARRCLNDVFAHVQTSTNNAVACVVFRVPEASLLCSKLLSEGCVPWANVPTETRGGINFVSLAYSGVAPSCAGASGVGSFASGGGGKGRGGGGGGIGGGDGDGGGGGGGGP